MELKSIVEAALFVAHKPLSIGELQALFPEDEQPSPAEIRVALAELSDEFGVRPLELKEVASGFRFQVREGLSPWISRLFEERPGRYSKAFLETLAIIAYRQPVTRGEIEDIRGVAVSSQIIRTLLERDWVQVIGHKEVPGRPGLYATTRQFLDYFNLRGLDELPPLHTFIDRLSPAPETESSVPEPTLGNNESSESTEESTSETEPLAAPEPVEEAGSSP